MIIGEQIITDKTELANHFNTYFGSIGAKTASAIDKDTNTSISYKDYLVNKKKHYFQIKDHCLFNYRKSSYGHDFISTSLIKRLAPLLIKL